MERTVLNRLFLKAIYLIYCFTLLLANASLEQRQDHLEHNALRAKRKTQESSTSAVHFMEDLRSSLTDESGKPKLSNPDDPTEVWAMQDRDVLNEVYRKKPKSSGKCVSENLFVFNCQSLTESLQHKALPVERAVLRAYLKVIPRHLSQNAPMRVNMDVYMRRMGSETKVHSGEMTLEVDADSAGWIELNITKGVRTLWPFHANETHIEISVVFNSECVKKSPVIFEDPASISLSQARRRQRLSDLQPLFLVFLTDEMVKEIVANETASPTEAQPNYNDDVEGDGTEATEGRRRKRSDSDDQACQLEDFDVVFADLGLDYVKAPYSYNAKRCRGSCSHHTLSRDGDLGNNHAKLMASAVVVAEHRPEKFQVQPEPVCCIPTKYTSMTLITEALDGSIKYVVYSHMKVTECKCR